MFDIPLRFQNNAIPGQTPLSDKSTIIGDAVAADAAMLLFAIDRESAFVFNLTAKPHENAVVIL